jgi:hypothetical protein
LVVDAFKLVCGILIGVPWMWNTSKCMSFSIRRRKARRHKSLQTENKAKPKTKKSTI